MNSLSITRVWIDPHQKYATEYRAAFLSLPELYSVAANPEEAEFTAADLLPATDLQALVARYFAQDVGLKPSDLARATIEITIGEPGQLDTAERRQAIFLVLSALSIESIDKETWTERPDSLLLAAGSEERVMTVSHRRSVSDYMNIQISDAEKRIILDSSIAQTALAPKTSIQDSSGTRILRPKFESVIRRWLLENEK